MAKLHFNYSTMNAGKSTSLLQSNHNYKEKGIKTLLFLPAEVYEYNKGFIKSRIGIKQKAIKVSKKYNFKKRNDLSKIGCIFIDEAQFLTKEQVIELGTIADELSIPVICYGLRTDFKGDLFSGSEALLAYADNINEIKTICVYCNKKATMAIRISKDGSKVTKGKKILPGNEKQYKSVCRYHYFKNK